MQGVEVFSLDTGQSCLGYRGFPSNLLGISVAIWKSTLVAYCPGSVLYLNLETGLMQRKNATFSPNPWTSKTNFDMQKRAVVLDDNLYLVAAPLLWLHALDVNFRNS